MTVKLKSLFFVFLDKSCKQRVAGIGKAMVIINIIIADVIIMAMANLAKAWNIGHWARQALQKLGREEHPDQTSPRRLSAGENDVYCVKIARKNAIPIIHTLINHRRNNKKS